MSFIGTAVPRILLVEDDVPLTTTLVDWFESSGHEIVVAHSGDAGFDLLKSSNFDLAIVDWQLPGLSGPEICSRFRLDGGTTAILMLTGKAQLDDKEAGLDSGADDYLPKPFDIRELNARVRALLRRPKVYYEASSRTSNVYLDVAGHTVVIEGRRVNLHTGEFAVFEYLFRLRGSYVSVDNLIRQVWQSDAAVTDDALRSCIRRIRNKVDEPGKPSLITATKGLGYKISNEYL